jgi:hypothetical protein
VNLRVWVLTDEARAAGLPAGEIQLSGRILERYGRLLEGQCPCGGMLTRPPNAEMAHCFTCCRSWRVESGP